MFHLRKEIRGGKGGEGLGNRQQRREGFIPSLTSCFEASKADRCTWDWKVGTNHRLGLLPLQGQKKGERHHGGVNVAQGGCSWWWETCRCKALLAPSTMSVISLSSRYEAKCELCFAADAWTRAHHGNYFPDSFTVDLLDVRSSRRQDPTRAHE